MADRVGFGARFLVCAAVAAVCLVAGPASARQATAVPDPLVLEVPGFAVAYYYKPRRSERRAVILYLHGRGANAQEDCRKWARVARPYGWVVCPQGPAATDSGGRTWNNDAATAQRIVDATLTALRGKYAGKVRLRGNILIGFSEGAFVAQQIGMRDPSHWNRWLILAANDQYWFGDAREILEKDRLQVRRVYLLSGENDTVAENTRRAAEMLKTAKIPVKLRIAPGLGHEVPADRMVSTYRRPLRWLAAAR
jgi:predicted esterase